MLETSESLMKSQKSLLTPIMGRYEPGVPKNTIGLD